MRAKEIAELKRGDVVYKKDDQKVYIIFIVLRIEEDYGRFFGVFLNDCFHSSGFKFEYLRELDFMDGENGKWEAIKYTDGCLDDDGREALKLAAKVKYRAQDITDALNK